MIKIDPAKEQGFSVRFTPNWAQEKHSCITVFCSKHCVIPITKEKPHPKVLELECCTDKIDFNEGYMFLAHKSFCESKEELLLGSTTGVSDRHVIEMVSNGSYFTEKENPESRVMACYQVLFDSSMPSLSQVANVEEGICISKLSKDFSHQVRLTYSSRILDQMHFPQGNDNVFYF